MMSIRIGFIDDSCDNYHANTFLSLLRGELSTRGSVVGVHALQAESGRTWAAAKNLRWYDDAAALARDCDALMVLAPSTPETHPELAKRALPAGLPTYIDKTFASDLAAAKAIFALADRHRAPVQSSSVLRWTTAHTALKASGELGDIHHVCAWGGGRSFGEYAIHPLELAVSLLGHEVTRVQRVGSGSYSQMLLDFSGERNAILTVACNTDTPMAITVTTSKATRWPILDNSTMFSGALSEICTFLADGKPRVDRRETLTIRAVLDAVNDPRCLSTWMPLESL